MARYREIPCKYYIALGQCQKGRAAQHKTYCQHCDKYVPRARVRCMNKKKKKKYRLEEIKRMYEYVEKFKELHQRISRFENGQ